MGKVKLEENYKYYMLSNSIRHLLSYSRTVWYLYLLRVPMLLRGEVLSGNLTEIPFESCLIPSLIWSYLKCSYLHPDFPRPALPPSSCFIMCFIMFGPLKHPPSWHLAWLGVLYLFINLFNATPTGLWALSDQRRGVCCVLLSPSTEHSVACGRHLLLVGQMMAECAVRLTFIPFSLT